MENHTNFSSLELTQERRKEGKKELALEMKTPSFFIQEKGPMEILVWVYRYWHRHRNRHVNITIVFYTV